MLILATLITALLFGGMVLHSFGFAAFLFTALPPDVAGRTLRRAFPMFYLFVLGCSAAAAIALWAGNLPGAALLALVVATVVPTRQVLMPAINRGHRAFQVFGVVPDRGKTLEHLFRCRQLRFGV